MKNNNLMATIVRASAEAMVRTSAQVMAQKAADLIAQLQGTEDVLREIAQNGTPIFDLQEKVRGARATMESVLATLNNL